MNINGFKSFKIEKIEKLLKINNSQKLGQF